jgi:hypothetical protein
LDDVEIRDLNGLGKEFTSDITNPFYKSTLNKNKKEKPDEPEVWDIEKENQILMKSRT